MGNLNLNIILTDMLKTILTAVAVSAVTITSQDAATVTVSERLLDDAAIGDTNVIAAYKEDMPAEGEDKSVAAGTSVLAQKNSRDAREKKKNPKHRLAQKNSKEATKQERESNLMK